MDDKSHFERLIDYYDNKGLTGLSSVAKKREHVRNEFNTQCARFVESLKNRDSSGVKDSLENISRVLIGENRFFYFENDEQEKIAGYSDFVAVVEHVRNGEKEVNFSRGWFNPFLGTPDEMLELCVLNSSGYYHPITSLLFGSEVFLGKLLDVKPPLSDAVCYYIEPWMKRMIDLVYADIDSVLADTGDKYDRNDDPDGYIFLGMLFSYLIYEPRLERVARYALDVLSDYLSLIENAVDITSSPLNTAIICGSEWAFDKLISIDGITKDKIEAYPEKNLSILDKIFNLGALIPGTNEGRIAFLNNLNYCVNPSEEIIRRTIHPSYFRKHGVFDKSLIVRALKNGAFFSDKHYLLVNSEEDINGRNEDTLSMPPLGYAVEMENMAAIKELFRAGADINWHDRWCNNIFHYIYAERYFSPDKPSKSEIEEIFEESLSECNMFGRTPYDYGVEGERSLLEGYEKISVDDVMNRIFSYGICRNASSLVATEIWSYRDILKKFFDSIRHYLEEKEGNIRKVEVSTIDQLDEVYSELSTTSEKTVIFIPDLTLIYEDNAERVEKILEDICAKEDIAVFTVVTSATGLASRLLDKHIKNIFVGNIQSALCSDVLLGQRGAEVLEENEFIFKQDDDFYLVDFEDEILQ